MDHSSRMYRLYSDNSPYEKFERLGVSSLTDAELLAIILRSGSGNTDVLSLSNMLLEKAGNSLVGLLEIPEDELLGLPGIGPVKAKLLKTVCELCIRMAATERKQRVRMNEPDTVAEYYRQKLRYEDKELLMAAYFNTAGDLLREEVLSIGTMDETVFASRELFRKALYIKASYIIIVHNHPSGDPTPSDTDRLTTKKAVALGKTLEIPIVDHIIIGFDSYYSFNTHGDL